VRGKLSDKLFPKIVRDLAHENATGRLRLTQNGKIREILIESGVPVFASSTIPGEQPESRLVQDGLISPEQLDAAIVISRQTSQPVEKILVQTKAITRLGLQRILCELSTAIVNSASEWIDGDYRFVAAPKVPLEAKLIWTSTECILIGARQASANSNVLDALAPDERGIRPASHPTTTAATLSSTEGYVLSCIQSPTTIAEACMLTGLSHVETRRAILVLILLGLLEAEASGAGGADSMKENTGDPPANSVPQPQQAGPAQLIPESRQERPPQPIPETQQARPTRPVPEMEQARPAQPIPENRQERPSQPISEIQQARPTRPIPEMQQARPAQPIPETRQERPSQPIPEIPEIQQARPTRPIPEIQRARPAQRIQDVQQAPSARLKSEAVQRVAGEAQTGQDNQSVVRSEASANTLLRGGQRVGGDAAIPSEQTRLQAQLDEPAEDGESDLWPLELESNNAAGFDEDSSQMEFNSGDISFVDYPERTESPEKPRASGSGRTQPDIVNREAAASTPEDTGSVSVPRAGVGSEQDTASSGSRPAAPIRENPASGSTAGRVPFRANTGSIYIPSNGESDPRLHQEWLDQIAAATGPDRADDEKSLKRVIEEVGAKQRIAASADYYQILGVDKLASSGSITKAFERITRINENHKSRWPHSAELQAQISSLMVVVNKAFETLGNPEKRRLYDMPPKTQSPAMEIERGSGAPTRSPAPGATGPSVASANWPPASRPLPPPQASPGITGQSAAERRNPYEAAEELYKRGRSCFAQSDLQAAAHLLRQAVNLDPNRSTYHYQLAMTLFILSQARAEHKHDKGCHVTCKLGGNLTRNQRIRHEAEQHLLKASELEPSNSDIKLKLALLYRDANMDRKAHQYFYEALMLDPDCHIARVELGMEDMRKRDEDQWIKDLMKDRTKKK
jgi:tetratricopeptide (TPR) repeat protein